MPELPEVHTIVTDLRGSVLGSTIRKVVISKIYNTLPNNSDFIKYTRDATILSVERIAKNILMGIGNNRFIHIHLAMTGQVLLREPNHKTDRWVRVVIGLEKNGGLKKLNLTDMRMFGKIGVIDESDRSAMLNKYGLDPVEHDLNTGDIEGLYLKLIKMNTNIKKALMDQTLICGLGNIYATDVLFLSGILPSRNTKTIKKDEFKAILDNSRKVLLSAISHRGSTLKDRMYVDLWGNPGRHQDHFLCYSQNTCRVCKNGIDFVTLNQRGTYFCPNCQK